MNEKTPSFAVKVLVAVTYAIMIIMNALANILPINNISTGDVSDLYPNLFAPAGITFSIWGVIYFLLALYVLYQFGILKSDKGEGNGNLLTKIGLLFSVSSIANAVWILTWHYGQILLSVFIMLVILICLILINLSTRNATLSGREKLFVRLPFSIYFGWITVATIANVTALLVDIGWNGFGISEVIWTVIILAVGAAIAIATMFSMKDMAYGLVPIWAYAGILIKHLSDEGFNGEYFTVIAAAAVCILLFIMAEGYLFFSSNKKIVY
ncbi:tryptophan-rich sensory protein [Proteiniclasticum sp.]|uniref:tryptophan-rich sensory protein n=1 Tax=Proteiniclasticum sp. TaxID=2053595 RepID=UPI0028A1F419|nr:tryptophan-rich sensory protein [Proteiniclasticum sp.]